GGHGQVEARECGGPPESLDEAPGLDRVVHDWAPARVRCRTDHRSLSAAVGGERDEGAENLLTGPHWPAAGQQIRTAAQCHCTKAEPSSRPRRLRRGTTSCSCFGGSYSVPAGGVISNTSGPGGSRTPTAFAAGFPTRLLPPRPFSAPRARPP